MSDSEKVAVHTTVKSWKAPGKYSVEFNNDMLSTDVWYLQQYKSVGSNIIQMISDWHLDESNIHLKSIHFHRTLY